MIKYIDLYAGIGGFHLAMESLPLKSKCVWACEKEPVLQALYQKNYGMEPYPDITTMNIKEIPDHDLLCAGFPCQAFSSEGKQQAFDDPRGKLFFYILHILKEKQPKHFLLENVSGLKHKNMKETYKLIWKSLREQGYHTQEHILSPHELGVPQSRKRIFFLGSKEPFHSEIIYPEFKKSSLSMKNILESNPDPETYYGPGSTTHSWIEDLKQSNKITNQNIDHIYIRWTRTHYAIKSRHTYVNAILTNPTNLPFLITEDRFLSIKEVARLQSIKDNQILLPESKSAAIKALANGLNIKVVKTILKSFLLPNKTARKQGLLFYE